MIARMNQFGGQCAVKIMSRRDGWWGGGRCCGRIRCALHETQQSECRGTAKPEVAITSRDLVNNNKAGWGLSGLAARPWLVPFCLLACSFSAA
jgi:hypothetical protein